MKKTLLVILVMLVAKGTFAQLPAVSLQTIDGKTIDTSTLGNDGKPFVISFFATWCKPCLRELTAIHEVYADWHDETGVKIYVVSIDQAQNSQKVKPLVDGLGWEYEVLLDPNGDFKRAMNVNLIPHVFVINGTGQIVDSRSGYTDGSEEHIIQILRELIKGTK